MTIKIRIAFIALLFITIASCSPNKTPEQPEQESSTVAEETPSTASKTILFFGNSLTAGYGLDLSEAFPALIQAKIDSLGLPYRVVNAGLSGETTASGNSRIGWVLNTKVDVFVLELGGNDGLRGISTEETYKNLGLIIDQVRAENPEVTIILAGMQIPPNMGADYTSKFQELYPKISEEKEVTLIPFLLKNVGGIAELNLPDGIHPTAEGHKLVAENVWEVLQPLLD
jgi:acyl-CoA thioesterase-1